MKHKTEAIDLFKLVPFVAGWMVVQVDVFQNGGQLPIGIHESTRRDDRQITRPFTVHRRRLRKRTRGDPMNRRKEVARGCFLFRDSATIEVCKDIEAAGTRAIAFDIRFDFFNDFVGTSTPDGVGG